MGSTVEQIELTSLNKLGTLENVADLMTKHVPRAVLDKLTGMMKKLKSFKSTRASIRIYWDLKLAAIERLPVFDDGENESLEGDVHSFVDKTSISRQPC